MNQNNLCTCEDVHEYDTVQPSLNFDLKLDEIHIWHVLPGESQIRRFDFHLDGGFIQMIFGINALNNQHSRYELDKFRQEQNLLLFIPDRKDGPPAEILAIDSQLELFGINISSNLFFKVLPQSGALYESLRVKIQNNQSVLTPSNFPVTMEMVQVIHQIIRCMRKDPCRCIYYQAKVLELLSLQLEQIESSERDLRESRPELKEEELKRVYKVRSILEANPEESFSLLGLAHAVGTNDSTLKKHFKIVFGTTVFTYLNSFRMERAKEMLLKQDSKISSIANQVGYKHATHFSAAFKKYFGYPPTKIKL